ncbi:MAG TPA: hypothetical protein VMW19_14530 [Myxococcota bacterium]|nr:hypothetical protein [Myxococcota bacterium]
MNRVRTRTGPAAFLALALTLWCGASSGEPRVPPDESLTPHEYERLGFPPLEADWNSVERTKARTVLRSLAQAHPEQLPRFASHSSGGVFAKLVDEEFNRRDDFEGEDAGSVPVGELEKMENKDLTRLIQRDTLEGIYAPESTGSLIFDRELVQFSSRRLAKLMALRNDVQARLAEVERSPSPGQDFAAQYRELIRFNDLALVQLITNVTAFAVAERFTPEARSDAGAVLAEYVPHLAPLLSPDAQERLRETIHRAAASPGADPRLKALSGGW